ncbi:MAG: IclR family transcriptional regulator [Anaerolineales bacterium]|nr:IclR family transcriptional regulator [Anaerolineales bacterium]
MDDDSYKYSLKSVLRAFKVIELLAERKGALRTAEIANILDIPDGTLHRFLRTLEDMGYLDQVPPSKEYQLSCRFLDIAHSVILQGGVFDAVLPYMKLFVHRYGFDASLHRFHNNDVYILHTNTLLPYSASSTHFLCGKLEHTHSMAAGKILLSMLSKDALESYLDQAILFPRTRYTITDKAELRREVQKVREQGYAEAKEEFEEGTISLAVPLRSTAGELVGALSFRSGKENANVMFSKETIHDIVQTLDTIRI